MSSSQEATTHYFPVPACTANSVCGAVLLHKNNNNSNNLLRVFGIISGYIFSFTLVLFMLSQQKL